MTGRPETDGRGTRTDKTGVRSVRREIWRNSGPGTVQAHSRDRSFYGRVGTLGSTPERLTRLLRSFSRRVGVRETGKGVRQGSTHRYRCRWTPKVRPRCLKSHSDTEDERLYLQGVMTITFLC